MQIFYGAESALAYLVGALAHGLANNGMTDVERVLLNPESEEYHMRWVLSTWKTIVV